MVYITTKKKSALVFLIYYHIATTNSDDVSLLGTLLVMPHINQIGTEMTCEVIALNGVMAKTTNVALNRIW